MPKLIIVDDEETIRLGLTQIIGRLLPEWEVAFCCEDAYTTLEQVVGTDIDLAIIDISMPGMDGLELAKELEIRCPQLHKIILTGHEKFSFIQTAMRYGVEDYLLKPVQREDLVHAVRKVEQLIREQEMQSTLQLEKLLLEWFVSQCHNRFAELKQAFYAHDQPAEFSVLVLFWDQESIALDRLHIDLVAGHLKQSATTIDDVIGVIVAESCTLFVVSGHELPSPEEWQRYIYKLGLDRKPSYNGSPRLHAFGSSSPFSNLDELRNAYVDAVNAVCKQEEDARASELPETDWTKELIIAIETNSVEVTKELLQQWQQHIKKLSEKHPARMTMYCIQLLAFLSSPALHAMSSKLAQTLSEQSAKFTQQLPVALTPLTIMRAVEGFIDGLQLEDANSASQYRKAIVKVQKLIQEEFANPELNLETIAQRVYLHPTYLSELFKETTGQKFIDYVTDVRMEEARRILRETDAKMYEVALAVGYTSPKYFSTLFRKRFQLTPMSYRERAQ